MGRRGCGKSFLAKKIQDIYPRKIIIDTLNEYSSPDLIYSFHEFCEKIKQCQHLNSFTLIYQFDPESEKSIDEFNEILRICYYFGNIQIVIEEIQIFASPHYMPHWLKQCLLIGRHQGLSMMFTTQRPGELNKTILSQCAHVFCGQMIEGNDVKYVSSFLNQNSEKLINLPQREFIYFSTQGIKQIKNDFSLNNSEINPKDDVSVSTQNQNSEE